MTVVLCNHRALTINMASPLPPEVAELFIDLCQHKPTLASCSLVCKAWHTRARFRLFSGPVSVVDVPGVPRAKEFIATLRHPLCTLHAYISSLSLRQSGLSASWLNPIIPVLVGLPNLTSLEIVAEHSLISDDSYVLFRTHFRSIRHLFLCITFATCADAVALICSFPLLKTLRLQGRWIGSSPPPPSSLPATLHTLALGGFLEDVLAWLLSCPSSPAIASVQLRDVAHHEFGIVFEYLKFVTPTLMTFQLSFLDNRSEIIEEFLGSTFDTVDTPELRALGVEGRLSDDVTLIVHLLSHLRTSHLEEISFTCPISVNHRRPAWAQLDTQLSLPAHACLRKVTVTTFPHLQRAIAAALPRLSERHLLDFVFPHEFKH